VLSEAYARTSVWDAGSAPPSTLFAVGAVRPLSPHQYAMTLRMAAASPEELEKRIESIENAARGWAGYFEQPGESFQVSVDEALLLSNGEKVVNDLLAESKNSLAGKLTAIEDRSQAVDVMFWNIVSRPPQAEEKAAVLEFLERRHDRPADGWRQAIWALLTSSECRFNY
jgi:hypothetical protein